MIRRTCGMICLRTRRVGIPMPLFPEAEDGTDCEEDADCGDECEDCDLPEEEGEAEDIELAMEGKLVVTGERAELVWHESELTGMEGSTTKIGFFLDSPGLVSMLRGGSVNTALVFEEGRRHICVYNTPFSAFEICVQGLRVDNRLLTEGTLELDYLIEIRGNRTERCKMSASFVAEQQ